jgi:hypothetical protein
MTAFMGWGRHCEVGQKQGTLKEAIEVWLAGQGYAQRTGKEKL